MRQENLIIKMVTSRQVLKKLKSLDNDLSIIERVNKLEKDMADFCVKNRNDIDLGCKIIKKEGRTGFKKLTVTNPNQLHIDLRAFKII